MLLLRARLSAPVYIHKASYTITLSPFKYSRILVDSLGQLEAAPYAHQKGTYTHQKNFQWSSLMRILSDAHTSHTSLSDAHTAYSGPLTIRNHKFESRLSFLSQFQFSHETQFFLTYSTPNINRTHIHICMARFRQCK